MKTPTYQDFEPSYPGSTQPDPNNSHLYDWVLHYNIYTGTWAAIPRECYQEYWNNMKHPRIIRSSNVETLIELIGKVSSDPEFLDKIQ